MTDPRESANDITIHGYAKFPAATAPSSVPNGLTDGLIVQSRLLALAEVRGLRQAAVGGDS